jgi:hypothetical protein
MLTDRGIKILQHIYCRFLGIKFPLLVLEVKHKEMIDFGT